MRGTRTVLQLISVLFVLAGAGACTNSVSGQRVATSGSPGGTSGPVVLEFREVTATVEPGQAAPPDLPPAVRTELDSLDCAGHPRSQGDPASPLITCDREGKAKYALAAALLTGKDVADARAEA